MTGQIDWREKQPSQVVSSRKTRSVEELETLPAGTKPMASRQRSPGGERRGKRKRETIFLERIKEGHRQSDGRGPSSVAIVNQTGEGHRQSDGRGPSSIRRERAIVNQTGEGHRQSDGRGPSSVRRERAIVNQTNVGTVPKARWGNF